MSKTNLFSSIIVIALGASCANVQAENWYVQPQLGVAFLSDREGVASATDGVDGPWDIQTDSGFLAGIEFGYQVSKQVRVGLQWEYRTNDSDTVIDGGTTFSGNLASNIFYLNGYYDFAIDGGFTPYVGAGLGYIQEIDIDLETGDLESSYSGDGEVGFQFIAGVSYPLSKRLNVNVEARYANFSGIDFEGEENAIGTVSDIDYSPYSLAVGISYRF